MTISQAMKIQNKRPIWAQSFSEKDFGRKGEDLPDDRMVSFIPVSWGGIKNWLIERELVLDASGNKALVERTMSMSGQLTKLTVIHDSGVTGKFTYRSEERIDRGEFGNDLTLTIDQVDLNKLFRSQIFVAASIPEAQAHPARLP